MKKLNFIIILLFLLQLEFNETITIEAEIMEHSSGGSFGGDSGISMQAKESIIKNVIVEDNDIDGSKNCILIDNLEINNESLFIFMLRWERGLLSIPFLPIKRKTM